MKDIKVLGSGCKTCGNLANLIQKKADDLGVEIALEKVTDMAEIMSYGAMSTPGVVIDGKLTHAGGMPASADIEKWLQG